MGYNTQEFEKEKRTEGDDYMSKNFLLVSLEEKKAKKIAEVLNNDTSRKIIDRLAQKDATESELSMDLKIPISTVHYNLKQLLDAGLVVVEEFHYSKKGKEVNHYTLANKYIIIAPKNQDSKLMDALQKIMPLAVITACVAFVMELINRITISSTSYASKASDQVMGAQMVASAPVAAQEISRPVLQSTPAAYFLFGGLAVLVIYFIYEFVRKK